MMRTQAGVCSECGKRMLKAAAFCAQCGAPAAEPTAPTANPDDTQEPAEKTAAVSAFAPPGWYSDPRDATGKRFWNGKEWTSHRAIQDGDRPSGTNGLAVASMILGILWISWLGSLLAVIFGHVARRQIRDSGGRQSGEGMAMAGLVLGWLGIAVLIGFVVLVFVLAAIGHNSQPTP